MVSVRTQVVIVGAGPAGLLLGHLLTREGIDNVIVERRSRRLRRASRARGCHRVRHRRTSCAESGAGDALRDEGLVHHGVEIRFDGQRHRIALSDLADGRAITVYGQQEVVKDLITLRRLGGRAAALRRRGHRSWTDSEGREPAVVVRSGRARAFTSRATTSPAVTAAMGFANRSTPALTRRYERMYPFSWLGILAEAPRRPKNSSTAVTRAASRCTRCDHRRSAGSIWASTSRRDAGRLARRSHLGGTARLDWRPTGQGEINAGSDLERSIAAMRSVVVAPMRLRTTVARGRRRAHRAANGGQGDEPGPRRRA